MEKTYPRVLLGGNEDTLLELQILGCKQVQVGFLLRLFLSFTFLDPLNLCRN